MPCWPRLVSTTTVETTLSLAQPVENTTGCAHWPLSTLVSACHVSMANTQRCCRILTGHPLSTCCVCGRLCDVSVAGVFIYTKVALRKWACDECSSTGAFFLNAFTHLNELFCGPAAQMESFYGVSGLFCSEEALKAIKVPGHWCHSYWTAQIEAGVIISANFFLVLTKMVWSTRSSQWIARVLECLEFAEGAANISIPSILPNNVWWSSLRPRFNRQFFSFRRFWHHQEHARSAAASSVELFPHQLVNKIGVNRTRCCVFESLIRTSWSSTRCCSPAARQGAAAAFLPSSDEGSPAHIYSGSEGFPCLHCCL